MPTSSKKESWFRRTIKAQKRRSDAFLDRRPHRSFRWTRRRDYVRPLELPGNFAFTWEVMKTLWKYKKIFLPLIIIYVLFYAVLVGMQSQDTYSALADALKETGGAMFGGDWGSVTQAGVLFLSVALPGVSDGISEAQMIFSTLIFLLMWLTTVWLLRNLLAGHKVRLRDGLYSSGAPLFATVVIVLIIAIQLIPVGIGVLAYQAASNSGLLAGGAAAMLFWVGAALLAILSIYWITSSLFAMIIVTLPGTYPYKAIRTAGDIMVGRRIKILLRWLWMVLTLIVGWIILLLPFIFIDMGVKALWPAVSWLPIVPVVSLIIAALSIVWISAYVYLLYRKVVDYVPKS